MAIIEDAFADGGGAKSKAGSARTSAAPTPAASARGTPDVSGDERFLTPAGSGTASPRMPGAGPKKKKLTRNQIKARDERRKARKLAWLTFGGSSSLYIFATSSRTDDGVSFWVVYRS